MRRFLFLATAIAVGLGVTAVSAQVQVATVEPLRAELAAKDVVSIAQVSGDVVTGRHLVPAASLPAWRE